VWKYALRRILLLIPTLLAVYTLVFILFHLTPGGPWDKERPVPQSVQEYLNAKYGLDKPLWQQYIDYLVGVITRFDLGPSYKYTHLTVRDIIGQFFPNSIQVGLIAMAVAVTLGITLGVLSAIKQNTFLDYVLMFFAIFGATVPTFVIGPLLVWLVVLTLGVGLPTGGWGTPRHLILPVITLALGPMAVLARYTRSSMLEVIRADYIRTARAKGLPERVIIVRHALKNALIPVITVAGVILAVVITGSFYVEFIFSIPGIGQYFVTSVSNRDYPVLMGVSLLFATVIAVMNLIVDLAYGFLDPRIRYQ